jgi:drug/metabolite transporter (DMT)-like permease
MRLKADLSLLLVAVVWGSSFVAQRIAGQMGNVYLFNGARFLLGALLLIPFVIRKPMGPGQRRWMLAAGAVLFVASALQQAGLQYTTAGNAGFITSLYVVLVPFVLFVFWREKLGLLALAAVLMAVAGAFLLSTGGVSFRLMPGDSLQLFGSLFWALHVVILGKFAAKYNAFQFSAGQFIVAGVLHSVTGLFLENPASLANWSMVGAVLYMAVFSVGVGYTLQAWGQQHTPPTDAALILGLESVFSVIFGWLLLREMLAPLQILGCVLIFGAVILAQARDLKRPAA